MISHTTQRFRKAFSDLPKQLQKQAGNAYKLFRRDPYHPSLYFKRVHSTKPVYSVRVNVDYRAVGMRKENIIVWFWIGSHPEYEKLLQRL